MLLCVRMVRDILRQALQLRSGQAQDPHHERAFRVRVSLLTGCIDCYFVISNPIEENFF